MTMALMFPGQGEQRPGMLHELPQADDLLARAGEVLGEDPLDLDSPENLTPTRSTQICLLLAGVAWARALTGAGARPDYLAGHSIGLWGAAVTAGAIDLGDAVRLVEIRGSAMAASSPKGSGMLAVDGLTADQVDRAAVHAREEGSQVWTSNVNTRTQVVVSGLGDDLDALSGQLGELGARRVTRLKVVVPAHTPLMEPARRAVAEALQQVEVRRPRVPVAADSTGQTLFTADKLRKDLSASITTGVRWSTAMDILAERGTDTWLQVPPGHALVRFAPGGHALAVEEQPLAETLARLRHWNSL